MLESYITRPIPLAARAYPEPELLESGEALVDMTDRHRKILFLASYALEGYPGALTRLWMREQVAQKLTALADRLPSNMALGVFDALRPLSVQQGLFDRYEKSLKVSHPEWSPEQVYQATCRFVAEPRSDRPSNHLTGGAVDLTLYRDGQPLPMGTAFDDFTDKAATGYYEDRALSEEEFLFCQNRRLLYHLMIDAGFTNYVEEWWHYDFGNTSWAIKSGQRPLYGFAQAPD